MQMKPFKAVLPRNSFETFQELCGGYKALLHQIKLAQEVFDWKSLARIRIQSSPRRRGIGGGGGKGKKGGKGSATQIKQSEIKESGANTASLILLPLLELSEILETG
ncbi:hypothetical protein CDAR_519191 [Caerostris darwini]|uniref:Uncharacterized protein n=1 Tax=Caerostris darwini TaxID=1538125 RepID=A0AAV4PLG1_9ARAC|nr:hypothetical protein CDAR_519191 [Caerostris darwini]